jgi:hypothetical protein
VAHKVSVMSREKKIFFDYLKKTIHKAIKEQEMNEAEVLYEQDKLTLIKKVLELQYIVDNMEDKIVMPTVVAALKAHADKIEKDIISLYRPSDRLFGYEVNKLIVSYFHPPTEEELKRDYWNRVGISP